MISSKAIELIKHYESLHDGDLHKIGLQPKMDGVGIWTEGWGHVITDSKGNFIKGIANEKLANSLSIIHTKEQADAHFIVDIQPILLQIARKITIPLNEDQLGAFASFLYNAGSSSTLVSLINTNSTKLYDWWISHYITGQGIPQKGLVYRRKSEATLFTKGILEFYN